MGTAADFDGSWVGRPVFGRLRDCGAGSVRTGNDGSVDQAPIGPRLVARTFIVRAGAADIGGLHAETGTCVCQTVTNENWKDSVRVGAGEGVLGLGPYRTGEAGE